MFFFRQVCFISKGLVDVQVNNTKISRHDIAEILLKLALHVYINQLIKQSYLFLPFIFNCLVSNNI